MKSEIFTAVKGLVFLALLLLMPGCKEVSPEQQAAEAALDYYSRLLEGYADGLLAAKAGADSLPDDYRSQLRQACEQYADDINTKHGGLQSVAISDNVGRTDSSLHVTYAFLVLSFRDSTREEVSVPMVLEDGVWKLK